jgi:hypothetical protein
VAGSGELLLETEAGSDRSLTYREGVVPRLLATDPTEELIDVVDDAEVSQEDAPSLILDTRRAMRDGDAMLAG